MAQAEIIREFLVQLGFKTDDKSLKKFTDGISGATKGVEKLVANIAGAALTVAAGVSAFAANMEALYFASMKTGASATSLKAFEKSAQNFGVASGEALASVQNLARWMRETPAAEGFLRSLGVEARDANGNLKDTTDIMLGLGEALRSKPYYLARQYANVFGISEDTLRAMLRGDFEAEIAKQRDALSKAGFEEASEKAHKFMLRLRDLEARIEAVGVNIGIYLLDTMERLEPIVLPILNKIAEGWQKIFDWSLAAAKAAKDYLPESVQEKIGNGVDWLLEELGVGTKGGRKTKRWGVGASTSASSESPKLEELGVETKGERKTKRWGVGASTSASSESPKGNLDPMRILMGMGWSKEQAAGIVANLRAESGMDPTSVGDNGKAYGIAQWHPDRQANFERWAGKPIQGSSLYEQLAFVNYELTQGAERRAGDLLRAAKSADAAGAIVTYNYERPRFADAEAAKRSAAAVNIAQQTTINVNGGDAASTASAVAGEQNRVAENMARNMRSVLN